MQSPNQYVQHTGSNADKGSKTAKTLRRYNETSKPGFTARRLHRTGCESMDRRRPLENVGCTREGERDKEFGGVLPSAGSLDLDFR